MLNLKRTLRPVLGAALLLAPIAAHADTTVTPSRVFPQASGAAEAVHLVSAVPAAIHGAAITTGATAGYFLILDLAADPGNGAVTPLKCVQVAANSSVSVSADPNTMWSFSRGIVFEFSTTGCFTLTKSATAFFAWQ